MGLHSMSGKKNRIYQGFTLMELLIVLVIIGLLAALVGPTVYRALSPAKDSTARAQVENFLSALDSYYVDIGVFPTEQEGLAALRANPGNNPLWKGPYLKKDIPLDPWGHPYVYRSPGRNGGYEIISLGADGKEGGDGDNADVNSWEGKKDK